MFHRLIARSFGAALAAVLVTAAPAFAQIAPTKRYLMSFHACDAAVTTCTDPANHRTYLAESDDGAGWSLVPGWTTFSGSVPDVIQHRQTIYVFAVGSGQQVSRHNLATGTSDRVTVTVSGLPSGRASDWVDPSMYVDDQGRLVLFFLYAPFGGGDPARCPTGQTTCTKQFLSATEVAGSDGRQFTVDAGDRATVALDTSTSITSASDPDVFFDGSQFVMYVSHGSSFSVWTSSTLRGTYTRSSALTNGLLSNNAGGVPAGFYDTATSRYWSFAHVSQNGVSRIRRALHATLSQPLQSGDWSTVLTASNITGLTSTTHVESPGFGVFSVQATLTVATSGSGTVTSSSGGISCGSSCSATYNTGTAVTLTAAASSGWIFSGWTGHTDCADGSLTMSGARSCTAVFVTPLPTPSTPGSTDLNGDGAGDVFRYDSTTGTWSMEYSNRSGSFGSIQRSWGGGWQIQAGDFNGDRLADMFLYQPTTGQWFKAVNNGAGDFTYFTSTWSGGWTPYVFELNGDGKSDVFLYSATTGVWFKCISTGTGAGDFSYASGVWSPSWTLYPADFNGDGKGDLFLYSAATGQWFRAQNDGGGGFATSGETWGPGWGISIGDFNADAKSDVFLYDVVSGQWFICTNTGTAFSYVTGVWSPGWIPQIADFDANRRADVWLYSPVSGVWVQALNNGAGGFSYASGTTGIGQTTYMSDFDGDGRSDVLFYDAATGAFTQAITNGTGTFSSGTGTWPVASTLLAAMTRLP